MISPIAKASILDITYPDVETNCDITYDRTCGTQANKRRTDAGALPGGNAGEYRCRSREGGEAGRSVTGGRQARNRAALAQAVKAETGRPASPHAAGPQQVADAIEFWKARGRPASRRTSTTVGVLAPRHPFQWDILASDRMTNRRG